MTDWKPQEGKITPLIAKKRDLNEKKRNDGKPMTRITKKTLIRKRKQRKKVEVLVKDSVEILMA